jgi:hypothetical protein
MQRRMGRRRRRILRKSIRRWSGPPSNKEMKTCVCNVFGGEGVIVERMSGDVILGMREREESGVSAKGCSKGMG